MTTAASGCRGISSTMQASRRLISAIGARKMICASTSRRIWARVGYARARSRASAASFACVRGSVTSTLGTRRRSTPSHTAGPAAGAGALAAPSAPRRLLSPSNAKCRGCSYDRSCAIASRMDQPQREIALTTLRDPQSIQRRKRNERVISVFSTIKNISYHASPWASDVSCVPLFKRLFRSASRAPRPRMNRHVPFWGSPSSKLVTITQTNANST